MKKHHEKVILKSDLFKARKTPEKTPDKAGKSASKSPVPKSSYVTPSKHELRVDPNELFQKVCCPNCKYVFKIIKETDILSQQPSKRKPTDALIHKAIQTDEVMKETLELKMLSEQLNKQLTNRNDSYLFPTDSFRNNSVLINQPHQSSHIREDTYRFEQLPLSKRQNPKRGHLDARSQSSSIIIARNKQKLARPNHQKDIDIKSAASRNQIAKRQERTKAQMGRMVIHKIESEAVLEELCQFYRQLPQSFQIPAYRKMLVQQFASTPINPISY